MVGLEEGGGGDWVREERCTNCSWDLRKVGGDWWI